MNNNQKKEIKMDDVGTTHTHEIQVCDTCGDDGLKLTNKPASGPKVCDDRSEKNSRERPL